MNIRKGFVAVFAFLIFVSTVAAQGASFNLIDPADGEDFGYQSIDFSAEITANENLSAADIRIGIPDGSYTYVATTTNTIVDGETRSLSGTLQLEDPSLWPTGTYNWTVTGTAEDNGELFESTTRTFTVSENGYDLDFSLDRPAPGETYVKGTQEEFSAFVDAPDGMDLDAADITLTRPGGTDYVVESQTGISGNSVSLSAFTDFAGEPTGTWMWHVNALADTGTTFKSSSSQAFEVVDRAYSFEYVEAPSDGETIEGPPPVTINLSVDAVPNTELDEIYILMDKPGDPAGEQIVTVNNPTVGDTVHLDTQYTANESGEYEFVVEGVDPDGNHYSYGIRAFNVTSGPYNFTLVSPPDGASFETTDTVQFEASIEAPEGETLESADISVFDPQGNSFETFSVSGISSSSTTITGSLTIPESFEVADYPVNGTWTWNVEAITQSDTEFETSATRSFEVTKRPVPNVSFNLDIPEAESSYEVGDTVKFRATASVPTEYVLEAGDISVFDPEGFEVETFSVSSNSDSVITITGNYTIPESFDAVEYSPVGTWTWNMEAIPENGDTFQVSGTKSFEVNEKQLGLAELAAKVLAEWIGDFVSGFFEGMSDNLSEDNMTVIAVVLAISIAVMTAYVSQSPMIGMGSMVLASLAFVVVGWLPSWIGFVFIVLTAAVLGFAATQIGGGG